MQPSSLIFVVIAGVWAAFFIQYWIRRREHLATARSVDAFSETMRVLRVRDAGPTVDVDAQPRRSYVVSPTKVVRPQVTVKRAQTLLHRPLPADLPGDHGWAGPPTGSTSYLLIPDRATRGLTFLTGVVATLVYAVLSVAGVLVPWAAMVPLALAAGGFVWLRRAAVAQPAARRAEVDRARPTRPATSSAAASARRAPVAQNSAELVAAPEPAPVDPRTLVFDVDESGAGAEVPPATAAASQPVVPAPLLDEDDMPLTWDPRPVPRPTYATKATATWVPVETEVREPVRPNRSGSVPTPLVADLDDDIPESFPTARRSAAG